MNALAASGVKNAANAAKASATKTNGSAPDPAPSGQQDGAANSTAGDAGATDAADQTQSAASNPGQTPQAGTPGNSDPGVAAALAAAASAAADNAGSAAGTNDSPPSGTKKSAASGADTAQDGSAAASGATTAPASAAATATTTPPAAIIDTAVASDTQSPTPANGSAAAIASVGAEPRSRSFLQGAGSSTGNSSSAPLDATAQTNAVSQPALAGAAVHNSAAAAQGQTAKSATAAAPQNAAAGANAPANVSAAAPQAPANATPPQADAALSLPANLGGRTDANGATGGSSSNTQAAENALKSAGANLPSFGLVTGNAASTQATSASSSATPAAAVSIAGLPVAIATRAQAGSNQFDIRLDPPELGRIDVRLSIDGGGQVTSHVTVDRPETLTLLQSQQPQLERALEQAGLKTADNGLQFSLRDQSFAGQNGGSGSNAQPNTTQQQLVIPDNDMTPVETAQIYSRLGLSRGLDITV